jgi:hypothetical protein
VLPPLLPHRRPLAWGCTRLPLFSTARPLYTSFPIILSTCFF